MAATLAVWTHMYGDKCPVCLTTGVRASASGPSGDFICARCGRFALLADAFGELFKVADSLPRESRVKLSSWLRERPNSTVSAANLPRLFAMQFPSVAERAEKLLTEISKRAPAIGAEVRSLHEAYGEDLDWQAISWSETSDELHYLFDQYLVEQKGWLFRMEGGGLDSQGYVISPAGHDFVDSLRQAVANSARGFCAMWFHSTVQPVWSEAIGPAIEDAGYESVRIDEVSHVNRIDDEILAQIRRSKFVVADFAGQRGGVYFEAGFALGLGLPVIWTVQKSELDELHFDTRQYNFLTWELDQLPAFRKALRARIIALFGVGPRQEVVE